MPMLPLCSTQTVCTHSMRIYGHVHTTYMCAFVRACGGFSARAVVGVDDGNVWRLRRRASSATIWWQTAVCQFTFAYLHAHMYHIRRPDRDKAADAAAVARRQVNVCVSQGVGAEGCRRCAVLLHAALLSLGASSAERNETHVLCTNVGIHKRTP